MTEKDAKALGRELLRCGGLLASRRVVLDDEALLADVARTLAEGLQQIEGHLNRVVLARPVVAAEAATDVGASLGLLDGGD